MNEIVSGEVILNEDAEVEAEPSFYGVSSKKLIIMSIFTLSIYNFYWFFKNFQRLEKKHQSGSLPLARAIFSPIFSYALFTSINFELENSKSSKTLQAGVLAALYFFLNLSGRVLPEPYVLISFLVVVPLLGANQRINDLNKVEDSSYEPDSKFTWVNWLFLVPLGLLTTLVFIGVFLPEA